ncbi:MAG: NAD(P)-dependent oxidoreductase [Alphaproteobacteria bacterium]|nr:NAD(P)-dependent oxidoreductase [Alphaproteobacteria bacterium]
MTKQRIGWIGLGKMGAPMARNLIAAGFPVTVYNRTAARTAPLTKAGAMAAASIAELAAASDIVVSMIADDPALEAVAAEVLAAARPGTIYTDMSTVSPAASSRVAAAAADRGIAYVRAPVSGSTGFAAAAQLIILVSGPADACNACGAMFEAMSRRIVPMGAGEEARAIKLVLNMMIGTTAAMIGEALAFGERAGLDWETMIDIIADSPVASPLVGYKTQMLKDRNFAPAFSASQMAKDFDLILDTARERDMPMPVSACVRQLWSAMMAGGKGELDMFACVMLLEEMAGLDAPSEGQDSTG